MSLEALHTVHIAGAGQTKAGGSGVLATDRLSLQGESFFDVILANFLDQDDGGTVISEGSKNPAETLLQSADNAFHDKNLRLKIAKLISENPAIAKEIETFALDQNTLLSETLALNQQAFDEILKSIEDGTIVIDGTSIEEDKRTSIPQILETLFINGEVRGDTDEDQGGQHGYVRKILAAIERLISAEVANPGFIGANLTPERIASIRSYYTSIERRISGDEVTGETTGLDEQPTEGIALGLIQIVPLQPKDRAEIAIQVNHAKKPVQAGNLISHLNTLVNGTPSLATPEGQTEKAPLQRFEHFFNQADAQKGGGAPIIENNQAGNMPQAKPNLSTLTSLTSSLTGSLSAFGDWFNELGLTSTPLPVTDVSNFTQLVTQAQHASKPHPAMQTIAAHIQKSIAADGNKNITLQLDPPELGKVEVQMTFGNDKNVKITVVSEKPETFVMLQRDAQGLERILNNAGLDIEGGMNFELASQDHDFDHNGGHDSSRNGTGKPGENAENSDVIESTMTWHVDPETGHMRYNLVV